MASFDRYLKTMLDQAAAEARLDGSATVEAEHLLLAVAADQDSTPGRVLASAGLDKGAIRAALDREFDGSLGAAGVARSAFDGLPPATPNPGHVPHPAHLLLGILQAQVGTVPRALAAAGIDRADLIARVAQTLT
jgi:ATP-dependent Clp protease ATP-binding subunit ClpA